MENVFELDKKNVEGTYARNPVTFVKGSGSKLTDTDGKVYIDFSSGIGVNAFGASDSVWAKAVSKQATTLSHISNLYYTEPQAQLAATLTSKTGAQKVFFCNSGAEANECAIKTARKYSNDKYGAGRHTILTLNGSFHGRTMATITATGQDSFHTNFAPFLAGFDYINPEISELKAKIEAGGVCALMLETIQGEGGVNKLPDEFLQKAQEICKKNDVLFVIDEVQTGNGRAGKLYSFMKYGLKPDIITTAKGLGGGLPIGACLFFERTAGVLTAGTHGSTFGGNPIACAGALTVIKRLDEAFLAEVEAKGKLIKTILTGAKGVVEVTGDGLMVGIKCLQSAKEVATKCLQNGLIVLTAKDKVRLLPPLKYTRASA